MIPSTPSRSVRARHTRQLMFSMALCALGGWAQAATVSFNGGAVSNCSYSSQVYTCSSLPLANYNDLTVIASGYTVKLSSSQSFGYNQGLQMSGTASLQSSAGSLDLSGMSPSNLNVTGGTLVAKNDVIFGSPSQTVTANISAGDGITLGNGAKLTGTLSAAGQISVGQTATVTGAVTGASIVTSKSTITGALTATGAIVLGYGTTITGAVSGATISTSGATTITGALNAPGNIKLGDANTITGAIAGATISAGGSNTITGALNSPGNITLGDSSTITGAIAGATITAGWNATLTGKITGSNLNLSAGAATVTGDVTVTGNLNLGFASTIDGNVAARTIDLATLSLIDGNAAAQGVTLAWLARVTKTITCTGSSTPGCGCVNDHSGTLGAYAPVCAPGAVSAPHHFQISHPGTALTCQPQAVTLTACGNSACTAPNFSNPVTVALSPGGGSVSFTGSASATVRQGSAGSATLSTGNVSDSCVNTVAGGGSCTMVFSDTGLSLSLSPANHRAGELVQLTVAALQNNGSNPSCVPLFKNVSNASVSFSCNYLNPVASKAAAVPVKLNTTWLAASPTTQCSGGGQAVLLNFDASGVARSDLVYAEVGQVGLSASYTGTSAPYLGLTATGSTSFIAAPASFGFVSTGLASGNINAGNAVDASSAIFLAAGPPFKVRVSALNSAGTVTSNFGQESTAPAVQYTSALVAPLPASFAAPNGTFPPTAKAWPRPIP